MKNKTLNYLTITLALAGFAGLIISYYKSGLPVTVFTYVGLTVIITALTLLVTARIQLGASFTVTAQANKLITTGLYKKFRHPIYYSGVLLIIGTSIFLHEPLLLIACIIIIIMQLKRIKNEEKVLEDKFGEVYRIYRKNTWF